MRYISLFAGIGGFDLALNRLGHECVWANEWDKYAAQIYDKNFSKGSKLSEQGDGAKTRRVGVYNQSTTDGKQEPSIDTRDIRSKESGKPISEGWGNGEHLRPEGDKSNLYVCKNRREHNRCHYSLEQAGIELLKRNSIRFENGQYRPSGSHREITLSKGDVTPPNNFGVRQQFTLVDKTKKN